MMNRWLQSLLRLLRLINSLVHVDLHQQFATLRDGIRWTILGSIVGVLSGISSAIFLITLGVATEFRLAHPLVILLLPLVGLLIGWAYYRFGGVAIQGKNLVIEALHTEQPPIPLRMVPMILIGTVLSHLVGGSVGREGTAVQMSASLADRLRRALKLTGEDRRLLLRAGISGGIGSVFGTPLGGFVFGLEVSHVGRIRYEAIIPCLSAAIVGDLVARALGVTHSVRVPLDNLPLDPLLLGKVGLAGIGFGLTALLFIELTRGIKNVMHHIAYPPLRPVIGGLVILALTGLFGTMDYLGLSESLSNLALAGQPVPANAFILKLLFTAVTLGSGFVGGEVTPLFVMGSTLGSVLGSVLNVNPLLMAGLGFMAVFAGASNTPLACVLMGVELFGGGSVVYLAVACFVAYLASGHRSIYATQRISAPKSPSQPVVRTEPMQVLAERRRGRLQMWSRGGGQTMIEHTEEPVDLAQDR